MLISLQRTYAGLNVNIECLRINQNDLNTKRMLDLMAVNPNNGPMPLYLHAVNRILRELRIEQQQSNGCFNYAEFKTRVMNMDMTPAQLAPLNQRLDTLESFMPASQTKMDKTNAAKTKKKVGGNDWSIKVRSTLPTLSGI